MQQIYLEDIIIKSNKFNKIEDVIKNLDLIIELARDDVLRIANSKKLFFADFYYFYAESAKQLKKTLSKSHLTTIKRIYTCNSMQEVIKFIIQRLLANMKNFSHDKNYKNYSNFEVKNEIDYQILAEQDDFIQADIENDLMKIDRETLKNGLKKAWNDGIVDDFDIFDFEKLCQDFNFNPADVLDYDPREVPEFTIIAVAGGHQQLAFVF